MSRRDRASPAAGCPGAGPGRRNVRVSVTDEPRHLGPIGAPVDPDADPAAVSDVRRHEETVRVGLDQQRLHAHLRGQPDREVVGTMVMVVELGEEPAADPPGRLAPRDLLRGLREREADPPQALRRRQRCSARPPRLRGRATARCGRTGPRRRARSTGRRCSGSARRARGGLPGPAARRARALGHAVPRATPPPPARPAAGSAASPARRTGAGSAWPSRARSTAGSAAGAT